MPRSKAAKGAHGSVVGARDRDVIEQESASADGSDGAAKLQKAHPRNGKSALGVRTAASDDCMLHAAKPTIRTASSSERARHAAKSMHKRSKHAASPTIHTV